MGLGRLLYAAQVVPNPFEQMVEIAAQIAAGVLVADHIVDPRALGQKGFRQFQQSQGKAVRL